MPVQFASLLTPSFFEQATFEPISKERCPTIFAFRRISVVPNSSLSGS